MASLVAERLTAVLARIAAAAHAAGRRPDEVRLLAVSKNHGADAVRAAHAAGHRAFGENRVQELAGKAGAVADLPDLAWHMIGSVQTNKVRALLRVPGLVLVHSLDRERLADALQAEAATVGRQVRTLLQVQATDDPTKHGCAPARLPALLMHVARNCPDLAVDGLMAIGPTVGDPAPVFAQVAALKRDLQAASGQPMPTLSMGMSGDLEVAIAHGATIVRVGTDVFGARTPVR